MKTVISGGNELLDAGQILQQHLGIGASQLVGDFGAGGAAYFTLAAAKLVGDQGQVYAVDILKTVLSSVESKARMHNLYNIKTVWSNLETFGATEIPEESLDYGMLVNILFQSKQHDDILKEVTRLVKPGGKLLVIDWDRAATTFAPSDADKVDPERFKQLAADNGWALEKEFKAGQYHFGLIFKKV